jgi:hypothetical protein
MDPSRAPASQAAAASRTVVLGAARIAPLRTAVVASARQALAAAWVGKDLRIFLPSRREKIQAS